MIPVVPLHLHFPLPRGKTTSRIVCQPEWPVLAGPEWENSIMELELADRFHAKQGRSIVRWTLESQGHSQTVYLKRHYRLPRWMAWASKLLPSRNWSPGLQEYANLQWAAGQGIPVPQAMAAGEFAGGGGQLQGFIAIAELTGMIGLHEAIPLAERQLPADDFREWKRGLFAEMARLSHLFHDAGVFHKDWYLCHFYIAESDCSRPDCGWKGRVFVIDLHRMKRHRWPALFQRMKDLAQLEYSAIWPGVDADDREGFWRCYASGMNPLLRGILRQGVQWKVRVYLRNHRRKENRTKAHERG